MVPWSHWRQPCLGWLMTALTSEFTHFNLVIHLSKVQHSPLHLLWCPAVPVVPGDRCDSALLCAGSRTEQPETFLFCCCSSFWSISQHARQVHAFQVWWSFLLMVVWWGKTFRASNSLELEQPFMPMWLDLTTVPFEGITHDFVN